MEGGFVPRKRIRGMYPPSGLKASSFGSSSSCMVETVITNFNVLKCFVAKQTHTQTRFKIILVKTFYFLQNKMNTFQVKKQFLTSRFTIIKLCASSEISLDSANLGFSADCDKQKYLTLTSCHMKR